MGGMKAVIGWLLGHTVYGGLMDGLLALQPAKALFSNFARVLPEQEQMDDQLRRSAILSDKISVPLRLLQGSH